MDPTLFALDNSCHVLVDVFTLVVNAWALRLVRHTKYDTYTRWLLYLVLSDVFGLLYRASHIIALGVLPADRFLLLWLDQFFALLDTAAAIASVAIMLRLFTDIASRSRRENAFKQNPAPAQPGTWPPPPT